jgi:F0F1-type ATP synthase membrane subunit b/b'
MKPANLAAQLAAAETELACLKLALAQVKKDRDELRRERDDWRREAETLCAEVLSPRSSERQMSGMSLPRSAAHGGG